MINKVNLMQFFALLFFSLSLSAQVSVGSQNLEYINQGQSKAYVTGCGNIHLASSASTSISMIITIDTYQSTINNSQSDFYIYTKKSFSAARIQRYSKIIPSWNWIPTAAANGVKYSMPVSFSINASDFDATGGTLFVVFVSPSGTEYTSSCTYTITTSLTLAQTSLGFVCGDMSYKTFTMAPANIPSGVNITYQWSYNGWSGTVNNSMSSITLTPTSTNSVPSNVSVTPYINGVAQAKRTCIVTMLPFAPNATISTGTICNVGDTKTYTINGLPSGCTVNWSSTNKAVATVASGTSSQVVMQSQTSGTFGIKATVTNSCGQIVEILSNNINVGLGMVAPIMVGFPNCYANSASPCVINNPSHNSGYVSAFLQLTSPTMESTNTYSDWEWENTSGRFAFSANHTSGNMAYGQIMNINFLNNIIPDQITFRCRVRNSCGWSNWKNFIMTFSDGVPVVVTPPVTPPSEYYIISPNPASSYANIVLKNPSLIPPNTTSLYVSVFTTSGSQVIYDTWINSNTGGSLYIGNLASYTGYILKIKLNNGNNTVETKYLMKN